jgi:hypothetical protein
MIYFITPQARTLAGAGQTTLTISFESMDFYRITILPSVIDKDITLANEMGDVLFNYEQKDLRNEENIELNNYIDRGFNTKQEYHDVLYKNDKLNSKNYSSYIEQMYRNSIGRR